MGDALDRIGSDTGAVGTAADAFVGRALADDEVILAFTGRIGATPYFRFTPYHNNDGVRVHHWTCLSVTARAMPGRALLFRPVLIEASDSDDYPLRHFSTEWVRGEARKARSLTLFDAADTPFANGAYRYEWGERDE